MKHHITTTAEFLLRETLSDEENRLTSDRHLDDWRRSGEPITGVHPGIKKDLGDRVEDEVSLPIRGR